MNILVIGTEKSIHDLKWIKFLAEQNFARFYFISEMPNVAHDDYKEQYKEAGVDLLSPLPSFSLSSVVKTIKGFRYIQNTIREKKIDLVHVIFPTPHLYWMTFSKTPTIVSTRGSDVLVVLRELLEKVGLKNKILLFLMVRNLKKVKYITCTSELQQSFLKAHFPFLHNKTSIVRTGINIDFIEKILPLSFNENKGKKVIFSPRFFTPIYNILSQVFALKKLDIKDQKRLHVVFVKGKSFDRSYSSKIMEALRHVHFTVEIHDYLSQEQMIQQYKSSDLIMMTPISDGTPNSALEAMACKKPLIISDLDYNSPLFINTSLKATPNNVDDILQKIQIGLNSYPTEYLGNAYEAIIKYGNQEKEMEKVVILYQKIQRENQ